MDIRIIKQTIESNTWYVTYKYWKTGECACKGVKITRDFDNRPTNEELISAI